jgi:hypothetical protein
LARVLFDSFSLSLSDGDRPDDGTRAIRKQTSLAYVPQDSLFAPATRCRRYLTRRSRRGTSKIVKATGLTTWIFSFFF